MLKVTIENKGSASLSIKGRHSFHIGAHSTVNVELPDTPGSANMLQRLRREYPAMRVLVERKSAQPPVVAVPSGAHDTPNASSASATLSGSLAGEAEDGAEPMSAEDFASRARVTAGEAGWWTVSVEGIRDIKVRSAKSEVNALEMAYAKYLEGQGTGQ